MIRLERGTATVTLEPLAQTRTMDGLLTVSYAVDDLLMAVTQVLVVLGDPRAESVDDLVHGGPR